MLKDALGSYRGSLEELNRAVNRMPGSAQAYYDRANAKSSGGDTAGAVEDYTKALNLGLRVREKFLAFGNRGIARADLGDIDGALEDFTAIIEAAKNRGLVRTALLNRLVLRKRIGDHEGAALDYQRALTITANKKGE